MNFPGYQNIYFLGKVLSIREAFGEKISDKVGGFNKESFFLVDPGLNHFMHWSLSIPPENIRNPQVLGCFQGE